MNYADLEEGEIRELVAPYTPVSNYQKSQWPSRASTTMSSGDCGSSSTSRTTDDIGTTRRFRGSNDSGYYHDSDDDSIRSSRPCTPHGLCVFKGAVPAPHAPGPVTMSSFPGLTRTNLESPTPQPTGSPRNREFNSELEFSSSSSELRDDNKRSREENSEPPVLCPAKTWEIGPDVYEKVQSALARVFAMDQAGAGSEQQTAGSQPAQRCSVQTAAEVEEYHDHKPPKSPLSPEELERAIGIIEELSVVNGVPPDVFVQSGVSSGTLYHAFRHLRHTLERSFPKSPAPSFCGK